ncbi:hypothetical protein EST38_g7444 [Candolleomyces aberdarensis]|uniref:PARP catalytic domain-containing protein n=1 Tax=Candolleomyces aberdarensis TaxID=2316362 RepID=A0A4Q2DF46_9AGAR|nr:hypothetical protein EST38_g7444 [Candolleomyces aberdarensis]
MPSLLLAALTASASVPVVPPKNAKKSSVKKKKSSALSSQQTSNYNPFKFMVPATPPAYSSTLPASFSPPAAVFPPTDATTRSFFDRGSLRSAKTSRSNRSLSSVFRSALAASASVPVVPPPLPPRKLTPGALQDFAAADYTNGHSTLNKSSSQNLISRGLASFTSTTVQRCLVCRSRPGSREYTITCCLVCFEKFCEDGPTDLRKCNVCHCLPKLQGQQQCGQTCAETAKVACLVCKFRPRNGKHDLCGLTCKRVAMRLAPFILEVPHDHTIFDKVERHFKEAWKTSSHSPFSIPVITKIFKIIENEDFQRPYELYRFVKFRKRVDVADPGGAFGQGIYTSSASGKAYDFCKEDGALLLSKVVLGRVKQVNDWYDVTSCPPGYDSVVFDHKNGTRNETILYSDDAIRPVFLIIFQ